MAPHPLPHRQRPTNTHSSSNLSRSGHRKPVLYQSYRGSAMGNGTGRVMSSRGQGTQTASADPGDGDGHGKHPPQEGRSSSGEEPSGAIGTHAEESSREALPPHSELEKPGAGHHDAALAATAPSTSVDGTDEATNTEHQPGGKIEEQEKRKVGWLRRLFRRKKGTDVLAEIGGSAKLRAVATRFYQHCAEDPHMEQFIENHAEPHGERLGNWFAEKLGGEGPVWSKARPRNARADAHKKAWHSHKRQQQHRGQRFKVVDCRIWMRLMFWAAREEGLADHERFWNWYVTFIGRFIRVYAFGAGKYGKESAAWSADATNIEKYRNAGFVMEDILKRA